MSTREIAIYDETYEAGQIAVGDQYKSVRFNSVGRMQLAIGSQGYGIIQNTPGGVVGEAINDRHHGISRHKVDGSGTPIVIGSPIMSSSGIGVVATAGNMARAGQDSRITRTETGRRHDIDLLDLHLHREL